MRKSDLPSPLRISLTSVLLLIGLSAVMAFYLWAAQLDPFLHPWDERFHALVAQNLAEDPLTPTLYPDTIVPAPYDRWDRAHIWLHKQPAFLWMMAASIHVFGNEEWALRLPSAIMAMLFVLALYRAGCLLVSHRAGIFSAIFGLSCYFLFDLVTGNQGTDHNDAIFLGWVSLSVLGWLEWKLAKHPWGFWLIGIAAGLAVLTKWLPGLWIFGIGAISILAERKDAPLKTEGIRWLAVLLIAVAIFLPWQLYIHARFPTEASFELEYNSLHLTEALEGHDKPWYYHLSNWGRLFGWATLPFMLLGIGDSWKRSQLRGITMGLAVGILAVFGLYTIAATKMPAYPFMVAFPILLFAGLGLHRLLDTPFLRRRKGLPTLAATVLLPIILMTNFPLPKLWQDHFEDNPQKNAFRHISLHNREVYRALPSRYPNPTIYFNLPGRQYVEVMYYTHCRAFQQIPSRERCSELAAKGFTIVIFTPPNSPTADSLRNLPQVILDASEIKGEY